MSPPRRSSGCCRSRSICSPSLRCSATGRGSRTIRWHQLVPFLVAPLAIGLLGGDREFWLAMIALNLAGVLPARAAVSRRALSRRPAPARLTEFYLWTSLGGVIGGMFAGAARAASLQPHLRIPDPDGGGACSSCPACSQAAARHLRTEAGPILALGRARDLGAADVRRAAAGSGGIAVPGRAGRAGRHDAVAAPTPARFFALVVLAFVVTGAVAAGLQPDRDRCAASSACIRWSRPPTAAIGCCITAPRCTAPSASRRRRHDDGARAADLLLFRRPDLGEHRSGARGAGRARPCRGGRARRRQPRLPPARGRELDLLRDRSGRGADCARSALLPFPLGLRAGTSRRARRRAPDAGGVADALRSDRARCVFLRRDPGASAHPRGAAGYLARLTPHGGILVLHISNRHMELASVVAAVGATEGLVDLSEAGQPARYGADRLQDERHRRGAGAPARPISAICQIGRAGNRSSPTPGVAAWTDDYSDILGAILRKKLGW